MWHNYDLTRGHFFEIKKKLKKKLKKIKKKLKKSEAVLFKNVNYLNTVSENDKIYHNLTKIRT